MWTKISKILTTNITWKQIVLGLNGDNTIIMFRNFLYSVIVYTLYKNWCKNIDNNISFNGNIKLLKCKYMILYDMYHWKSLFIQTDHPLKQISQIWTDTIAKFERKFVDFDVTVNEDIDPMSSSNVNG